ncbi:hypothetical protein ASC96_17720 [Rhizobium sp. Root1204]|nr:hypothetical protein ASC96_17720 [Rhizobium sp. Root1204]
MRCLFQMLVSKALHGPSDFMLVPPGFNGRTYQFGFNANVVFWRHGVMEMQESRGQTLLAIFRAVRGIGCKFWRGYVGQLAVLFARSVFGRSGLFGPELD